MRRCGLVLLVWALAASRVLADPSTGHSILSETLLEDRRSVVVRVEGRLDEPDVAQIAAAIKAHEKKPVARTVITFYLAGAKPSGDAWASVVYAPDAKIIIHGLSRHDEEMLTAEMLTDRREIVGAWLTAPPAPAGRLAVVRVRGKLHAEWRMKSGLKTVDDLRESQARNGRRFDIAGGNGNFYVLNWSGALEIWDKTAIIATAERIRLDRAPAVAAKTEGPPRTAPATVSVPAAGVYLPPPVRYQAVTGGPVQAPAPLDDLTTADRAGPLEPAGLAVKAPVAGAAAPVAADALAAQRSRIKTRDAQAAAKAKNDGIPFNAFTH